MGNFVQQNSVTHINKERDENKNRSTRAFGASLTGQVRKILGVPILIGATMVCGAGLSFAADLSYTDGGYKDAPSCNEDPVAMKERLVDLQNQYGYKGFNIPVAPMQDSLLKDSFCWRSTLAQYGFGFQAFYNYFAFDNMLSGYPSHAVGSSLIPGNYPAGKIYPSDQQYSGQRFTDVSLQFLMMTYDLGRLGLPGGQLQAGGYIFESSFDPYLPSKFGFRGIAYYQSLFDGALETKVGITTNTTDWVGNYIGGNIANPLGASIAIPVAMGMAIAPDAQPTARATWHITDRWYDQFGVLRSTDPAGPTGNIVLDDAFFNKNSLDFSVPNGNALVVNEFGYRNAAGANDPQNWMRFGYMYNTSTFHDYSKGLGATPALLAKQSQTDVSAYYALVDRQLWQMEPNLSALAYKGIYAGASYFYAPPTALTVYQDIQLRLYGYGLIPWRPSDMITVSWDHNSISPQLAHDYFAATRGAGFAHTVQNVSQIAYTYKFQDGLYGTFGFSYTDHPVVTVNAVSPDAHDLNFNFILTVTF